VVRNIHFIINSLSPNALLAEKEIHRHFHSGTFKVSIKTSDFKGHSVILAMDSISEGAEVIVACGGDGTVNEVASCLVNSSVILGLLPIGSGNGLARHLALSTYISTALETIKKFHTKKIDVGSANDRYFFCNVSVAFSAAVIHCYSQQRRRGLAAYTCSFAKAVFSFSYKSFELTQYNASFNCVPFILLFSNTNQLGYNRTLTPDASLFDGKLDMIRVEKAHPLVLSTFMFFAFFRKFPPVAKVHRMQLDAVRLSCAEKPLKIQLDGEELELDTNTLDIGILPGSLEIIC